MKKIKSLIITISLSLACSAIAQDYQFRDQYGMVTGSANWEGDRWQFRDQYGMTTGTAQPDFMGGWQFRDQYGFVVGTQDPR